MTRTSTRHLLFGRRDPWFAQWTNTADLYLLFDVDLPDRIAWILGNEAHGLSDDILAAADHRVSIPIQGSAESLNLATAASICLWESSKALAED